MWEYNGCRLQIINNNWTRWSKICWFVSTKVIYLLKAEENNWFPKHWQITVCAITKLNNCHIIRPLTLFSYFHSGGSKKLSAIYDIPGSYLQVMCWVLGQWKGSEKCTINHFLHIQLQNLLFITGRKKKKFTTKTALLYRTINKETPSKCCVFFSFLYM